jgi:hypothetical protein
MITASLERNASELGGRLDVDHASALGTRQGDVGADQRHLGAAPVRLGGERDPHAAGGAVADVAHGVDRLARPARGDEQPQAVHRPG